MSIRSFGTTLSMDGTALAGVRNIDRGGRTVGDIQTTTNDDAADNVHLYEAGIKEPGTLTLTLVFEPSEYQTLLDAQGVDKEYAAGSEGFEIEYVDGSVEGFAGYVKDVGTAIPWDEGNGEVTCDVSIKVSGDTTFEPPAA